MPWAPLVFTFVGVLYVPHVECQGQIKYLENKIYMAKKKFGEMAFAPMADVPEGVSLLRTCFSQDSFVRAFVEAKSAIAQLEAELLEKREYLSALNLQEASSGDNDTVSKNMDHTITSTHEANSNASLCLPAPEVTSPASSPAEANYAYM